METQYMSDDPYAIIAAFYDRTMAGFDDDIAMYANFAARMQSPVLELGAGTGRVACALAQRGHRVVAIDRSPAMLAIARERARHLGAGRLSLLNEDMREPRVGGAFGLIICARDTFLHLANTHEQLATLRAARAGLSGGGRLILDLPALAGDWGDWEAVAHPLVLDWSEVTVGVRTSRLTTYRADAAEQRRVVTDIYEVIEVDGTNRRYVVEYALRFVFPAEMLLLLQAAGLELETRFGNYDLDPYDAQSERMIVVAREAGSH